MITEAPEERPTKKFIDQTEDLSGRTADRCQGFFTYEPSHNNCINGIVELLKKGAEDNWKKEQQKRFPDGAFGNGIGSLRGCFHTY